MKTAVVIMSRIPQAGHTKTRLLARLEPDECARLHKTCLRDICRNVRKTNLDGYIYHTGDHDDMKLSFSASEDFWELLPEDYLYFKLCQQKGLTLGDKLFNAADEILFAYDAILFLGSDAPCINSKLISEANNILALNDIVLGPAQDGGYYLLGIKNTHKELFTNISWGSSEVMRQTILAAESIGLSYSLLETQADIDTWEDLLGFYSNGQLDPQYRDLHSYHYAGHLVRKYYSQ